MRIHFFTAPFYFAFIWFRVQGSGFKVQGLGFRVQVAAKPPPYNKAPSTSVGMTFKKDG